MAHAEKSQPRSTLEWLHSYSNLVWSAITNTPLLTFMIALGTLLTAFVAYQNGRDTHEQVQLLKRQVEFNSTETRPFLRLKPSISPGKEFRVLLGVISLGRIPARVVAYDMVVQVGQRVIEPKGGTFNIQDILYPDQPGLGVFQTLTEAEARPFAAGSEPIVAGGCVIYGPITADDTRRWEVSAAYRFDRPAGLPLGLFAHEAAVSPGTSRCDASSLRDEWLRELRVHPR